MSQITHTWMGWISGRRQKAKAGRRPARKLARLPLRLERLEIREVPAAGPNVPALSSWWGAADVGAPTATGFSGKGTDGLWAVQGAGGGVGGTADQLHLAYRELTGDGTMVAKLAAPPSGGSAARAGLMMRDSLDANSSFAAVSVGADNSVRFDYRATTGGAAASVTYSGPAGGWFKLVRNDALFSAYTSTTGAEGTWTLVGTAAVTADAVTDIGLAASSGSASAVASAKFDAVAPAIRVPLGANTDTAIDWTYSNIFVDIVKQARSIGPYADPNGNAPLDVTGAPTTDFSFIAQTGMTGGDKVYNGVYKLSFTGQAEIEGFMGPVAVSNVRYDAAANRTTADVTLSAGAAGDWYFGMRFRNTRRTAGSAVNSGLTDLKLIRPQFTPSGMKMYDSPTQTFTTAYMDHLQRFSTLRFMGWSETNNSPVTRWSDRNAPTRLSQAGLGGVAWEYAIELANTLGKDMWVNVPHNADADYVRQLATLLKNNLRADLAVYVEYSNEVWNWIFSQANDNYQAAQADPTTAYDNADVFARAYRRVGKKIKEVSDGFRAVWGDAAMNTRVRPVLAGQSASPYTVQQGLDYINRTWGDPSRYLYAVAGAPYFSVAAADQQSLTPRGVLDALAHSVDHLATEFPIAQMAADARRFGLKMLAYEGGPDTFGPNNLASKKTASLDPTLTSSDGRTLAKLTQQYLDSWYANGGSLFNWFIAGATSFDSQFGTWGLTNDMANQNVPKILGIDATLAAAPAAAAAPTGQAVLSGPANGQVAAAGQPFALTATIAGAAGGTVSFYDGAALLGTATVSGGRASYNVTSASAGNHLYRAVYQGGAAGQSPALAVNIGGATTAPVNPAPAPPVTPPPAPPVSPTPIIPVSPTPVTPPPASATAPVVKVTPLSPTSATLSWGAVTGAASYVVERSLTGTGNWVGLAKTTGTSYTIGRMIAGKPYYYRVTATPGGSSAPVTVSASSPTTPTPAPAPAPAPTPTPAPTPVMPVIPTAPTLGAFNVGTDVGRTGTAGSTSYDAATKTYTVRGAGWDVWENHDAFQFASTTLTGNATLVARVASQSNTNGWAKSGLMFRAGTGESDAYAMLALTPTNGIVLQWRTANGQMATYAHTPGVSGPVWLRLERTGGTFTGYYSTDGTTWRQVGTTGAVAAPASMLAGLSVSSHDETVLNATTFTNVTIA